MKVEEEEDHIIVEPNDEIIFERSRYENVENIIYQSVLFHL